MVAVLGLTVIFESDRRRYAIVKDCGGDVQIIILVSLVALTAIHFVAHGTNVRPPDPRYHG
jgi:hypothetical protein